jgi:hypothetical protein
MSQAIHGQQTIQNTFHVHTPRKHIVPTHLNMPDQVLSVWSLSLSARQLLLLLVGCGLGGTVWQHLAALGHNGEPFEILRFLLSLPPFLLALLLAWYRYADRYLEVWLVVLMRYQFRPKRYLWRSIRHDVQHLTSSMIDGDEPDREDSTLMHTITISAQMERT